MVLIFSKNGMSKRMSNYRQWVAAILANTTVFTYGLHAGWISPMTPILQSDQSPTGSPLTGKQLGAIATTMSIAAVCSVVFFAHVADKYGRKFGLMTICVAQTISWILKLAIPHTTTLVIARIFCGISAAGCFSVVPMYVKEVSSENIRGTLGVFLILFQNSGILTMYAIGTYLDYFKILWLVFWMPMVSLVVVYVVLPESPAFLVKTKRFEEASKNLAYLRGLDVCHSEVQNEIASMINQNAYYETLPYISIKSLLSSKACRRGMMLALCIITIQCSNGSFAIVTYASRVLPTPPYPAWLTLSFPAVMILGSFVSMICVERLGRKRLFITSLLTTALALASLGAVFLVRNYGSTQSLVPVSTVAVIVTLFSYATGVSPTPYVVMTEMFNFQIRAKVMSYLCSYAWFMVSLQLGCFVPITELLGMDKTFFCFATLNFIGALWAVFMMVETKGKTTAQIEMELGGK